MGAVSMRIASIRTNNTISCYHNLLYNQEGQVMVQYGFGYSKFQSVGANKKGFENRSSCPSFIEKFFRFFDVSFNKSSNLPIATFTFVNHRKPGRNKLILKVNGSILFITESEILAITQKQGFYFIQTKEGKTYKAVDAEAA